MDFSSTSFQKVLEENILSFWIEKMVDNENGGFYGRMDGRNEIHPDAPKGIIMNTRILWAFSCAHRHFPKWEYKEMADRAFDFLRTHFLDQDKGGVYWTLDAKGQVRDSKKQVYAQAFMIYALAEYHLAFGREHEALDLAKSIYRLTEKHSFDQANNGYLEAFDRDWYLLEDLRLSDKDANEAKTMNTHLHVLEAYTNLYRIWKDDGLAAQLRNLIRLFLERFIGADGHLHLFFDEEWHLKSSIQSYGHDIEAGWLIYEAAEVLGESELLEKTEKVAIQLTDAALEGMDTDGALMNEGGADGIEDTDKHWWPQAEALVGLVNAFQISKDSRYLESARGTWVFIQQKMIDSSGEWHWMVSRQGEVNLIEDKAGSWKGPYHNSRAMIELIQRLNSPTFDNSLV